MHISDHKTELAALKALYAPQEKQAGFVALARAAVEISESYFRSSKEAQKLFYQRHRDVMGGFPGIYAMLARAGNCWRLLNWQTMWNGTGSILKPVKSFQSCLSVLRSIQPFARMQEMVQQVCAEIEGEEPV